MSNRDSVTWVQSKDISSFGRINFLDMFILDLSTTIWIGWKNPEKKLNAHIMRYALFNLEPFVGKVKCMRILGLPGPMRKFGDTLVGIITNPKDNMQWDERKTLSELP